MSNALDRWRVIGVVLVDSGLEADAHQWASDIGLWRFASRSKRKPDDKAYFSFSEEEGIVFAFCEPNILMLFKLAFGGKQ